jgi:hypothetical protein
LAGVSSAIAVAALTIGAATSSAAAPRPGPAILYDSPAVAPELTNTGIWTAPPILVSGTTAYRSREFLYQDYLYDDHGAHELPDPNRPARQRRHLLKAGRNLHLPDGSRVRQRRRRPG